MSRIGPDDEGGEFVGYIGCNRMVRFQGTGAHHLPSNEVDQERDDRVYVLFRAAIVLFRSAMDEMAMRDDLRSTIGIGWSFGYSGREIRADRVFTT